MMIPLVSLVCGFVVLPIATGAQSDRDDSSCTQIDFDEATLTSLRKCDYMQEFVVKRYDESAHFNPYRPGTLYYLSNRWEGLTCGETVETYSFNADTELRMAYNLVFDSGATLEVRVFDLDRHESDNKPILVEVWRTTVSTEGWGFFREKLNKTVKKARIQIEATMNAGSDLAIEYLTIFNYEVETEECGVIDEFLTTTEPLNTTTSVSTTTETTVETFPTTTASTVLTTVEEITPTTTVVSEGFSTTTSEEATTTSTTATTRSTTTTVTQTTTTNAPRDDTSMLPSSSTTVERTSTVVQSTASTRPSTISTAPSTPASTSLPEVAVIAGPTRWVWVTLTGLFATLFLLAASVVCYMWFVNQHLDRAMMSLLQELAHPQQYKK